MRREGKTVVLTWTYCPNTCVILASKCLDSTLTKSTAALLRVSESAPSNSCDTHWSGLSSNNSSSQAEVIRENFIETIDISEYKKKKMMMMIILIIIMIMTLFYLKC